MNRRQAKKALRSHHPEESLPTSLQTKRVRKEYIRQSWYLDTVLNIPHYIFDHRGLPVHVPFSHYCWWAYVCRKRWVKRTEVGEAYVVSTVFMGFDLRFNFGREVPAFPTCFETMLFKQCPGFRGLETMRGRRAITRQEAMADHAELLLEALQLQNG